MSSVAETINELQTALKNNANEHQLLASIEQNLDSLRSRYRTNRNEYSDEAIEFLKSLASVQEALREFIEAIEEKAWVSTRDDAQDLASRFSVLKDKLSPHLVAKRAEKELREVIAQTQSLPFAAVIAGESEFHKRRARLENAAKPCKCGSRMVLRESQNGYFWGCSTFPTCFARRWLTTEDSEFLFP